MSGYTDMPDAAVEAAAQDAAKPCGDGTIKPGVNPALFSAGVQMACGITPDWRRVAADADYCEELVPFP